MPDGASPEAAPAQRGVSPIIGAVLMIVITVLLAATLSVMVTGLLEPTESPPSAQLDLQTADCNYTLVHEAGEAVDGDRLEVRGVNDSDLLSGETLAAGTEAKLEPVDDEVQVIWASETDEEQIIGRFDVDEVQVDDTCGAGDTDSDAGTTGEVYSYTGSNVESIPGDNGSTTPLTAANNPQALGPVERDLTGDGRQDLPFISGSGNVLLTNGTNETTTVADSDVGTDKTRLAVGTWNGSNASVFYVDSNDAKIYRATPTTAPETVAKPDNGAQAVIGPGDVDGDGTDELVFADGSQQLRYLEPDGNIEKLQDGGAGQNNAIGAGGLADFDGDGTESVVFIDGSNNVKMTNAGGSTTTFSSTNAKKTPPTTGDIDGDGSDEIVYVGYDNGYLKYVDDVGGNDTIEFLTDEDGNKITGSDTTGVT